MELLFERIHRLTEEDLLRLEFLEREAFGPDGLTSFSLVPLAAHACIFVARNSMEATSTEKKGTIIAAAEFFSHWLSSQKVHMFAFYVASNFRGAGTGKKFLDWILLELRAQGVEEVDLTVSPLNKAAVRLYSSRGFEIVSFEKDYYRKGEDRYIMRKKLV